MHKILLKEMLAERTWHMRLHAPLVARKCEPGQFLMLRIRENGERIPLTIADWDRNAGTIDIYFQELGATTHLLATLSVGDSVRDVVGPLGNPSEIEKVPGTFVMVGGGFGIAAGYPVARGFKEAGNRVVAVLGARTKDLLICEEMLKAVCDEVLVATNDGSYGTQGVVSDVLRTLLERGEDISLVFPVGPPIMMKIISGMTRPLGIKTVVSLNSVMVDGTGMCGSCRVTVGGKTRFVCSEGIDFDGHEVDWDEMMSRQKMYGTQESEALSNYHHNGACMGGSL
ncbi:sulfide/dihydroorotate dehydrogenase-like FAD/NAD-binding protein [Geomonas sp. RF6]|uniref:sulfide/dihydroorotate dehydrogenase-like FAD/NAD-binding protein n=1 Tax=Geomonas sp. RF6 TaxID=2897342 RepID=UPI001E31BDC3|nr:sulfide/dihydroorotate dehydrogenase-like FAD/NAD-binding protein [Geomonas sp. RF6]UFS69287.1 sulfide/dihydroorotate dehydrogenase-like FAD/NAD-binding protein [Geomonas sp. RF6]